MHLFTTYHSSPAGLMRITCSDDHIREVLFIDELSAIQKDPHPLLEKCIIQLDEYFSGSRKAFDLPLDQHGTDFQKTVWKLLVLIPFGKTISYNRLALDYGDPKAIRAVASANGKNKLAIIVPCHRVIGSDQSLTGYAGGIQRKKWLLEHEMKISSGVKQMEVW